MIKSLLNTSICIALLLTGNSYSQETQVEKFLVSICSNELEMKFTPCVFKGDTVPTQQTTINSFGQSGMEIMAKFSNTTVAKTSTNKSMKKVCNEAKDNKSPMIALRSTGMIIPTDCFCNFKSNRIFNNLCQDFDIKKLGLTAKLPALARLSERVIAAKLRHDKYANNKDFCPELKIYENTGFKELLEDIAIVDLTSFPTSLSHKEINPEVSLFENLLNRAKSLRERDELKNNEALIQFLYESEHGVSADSEAMKSLQTPESRMEISTQKLYPKTIKKIRETNYFDQIKKAGSVEDYIGQFFSDKAKAIEYIQNIGSFNHSADLPKEVKEFEASLFLNSELSDYVQNTNELRNISPYDLENLINDITQTDKTILDYEKEIYDSSYICKDLKREFDKLNTLTSQKNGHLIKEANTNLENDTSFSFENLRDSNGNEFLDRATKISTHRLLCLDDDSSNVLDNRGKLGKKALKKAKSLTRMNNDISALVEESVPEVVEKKSNEAVIESFESSAQNFKKKVSKISNSPKKDNLIKEFNSYANQVYNSITNRSYPGGFDIERTPIKDYSKLMSDYSSQSFNIKAKDKAKKIITSSHELKEELKTASPERKREIQRLLRTIDEQLRSIQNEGIDIDAIKRDVASAFASAKTNTVEVIGKPKQTKYKTEIPKQEVTDSNRGVTTLAPAANTSATSSSISKQAATNSSSSTADSSATPTTKKQATASTSKPVIKPIFLTAKQEIKDVVNSSESKGADFLIIYDSKTDKILKHSSTSVLWSYEAVEIEDKMKGLEQEEKKYILELLEKRNRFKAKDLNSILSTKR